MVRKPKTITIRRPWDMHFHARDGEAMAAVINHTASVYAGGIVMPNLSPPVTTVVMAESYMTRLMACLPADTKFIPMMTLYLTAKTTPEDVYAAAKSAFIYAYKYYPKGQTTGSGDGASSLFQCLPAIAAMQDVGMPLLVHGETVHPGMLIFNKERHFYGMNGELARIIAAHLELKVSCEHMTSVEAVDFVKNHGANIVGTITPQHPDITINDVLEGGIKPHNYCLPIAKEEADRQALFDAMTSGDSKFFLGTDSAPHGKLDKESACGCAGCYTAPHSLMLYATMFEKANALDRLAGFASEYGPKFYGLPVSDETITLVKKDYSVPDSYEFKPGNPVIPFRFGKTIPWSIAA